MMALLWYKDWKVSYEYLSSLRFIATEIEKLYN